MRFSKYITNVWPPIIDGYLVRSSISGRLSNAFSQYLQVKLTEYVQKCGDCFWLSELECQNHQHKLDYMIIGGSYENYLKSIRGGKDIRWIALIESQWGNNNQKKIKDFLERDFPKLLEWPPKFRDQIKVAIVDTTRHPGDSFEVHRSLIERMHSKVKTTDQIRSGRVCLYRLRQFISDKLPYHAATFIDGNVP